MSTSLKPSDEQAKVITGCLMLLAIIALTGVFYITKAVLIPFVIAIFIVTIVTPIVDLLVLKMKFPQIVAISATLLLVLSAGFVLSLVLIYSTQQVIATAESQYSEKLGIFISSTFDTVKEVSDPRQDTPAKTEEAVEKEAAAPKETTVDSTKPAVAKKPQTGWLQKIGVDLN
nr:AI-2E family transporter [Planctomycetota bacterium]